MNYIIPNHTCQANAEWTVKPHPFFSIITPVYNRRLTISRTMRSIDGQTYRNIEYIIVDDGSTISSDDLINEYMSATNLPVLYLKKSNGGVQTARNLRIEYARGEMIIFIDSDDELLPKACETFYDAWNSIPLEKRERYWQIKAQCIDETGKIAGQEFPKDVNERKADDVRRLFSFAKGEQIGCYVTSILKENRFLECEGVTYTSELALFIPMEQKYLSWGINDVVRIYHTEGDDHINNSINHGKKRTIQSCRNSLWNAMININDPESFCKNII